MRVGFNARILADPSIRGWNRYTLNLIEALRRLEVECLLYTDGPIHAAHRARLERAGAEERLSPRMRYLRWEQRWLPRACRDDGVMLLHTPFNFGLPWVRPCPTVLTLHDAIDVAVGGNWSARTRLHHWVARTRAHRVITPSAHAKRDLRDKLGIADSKIAVVFEAADPRFHQPIRAADRTRIHERYGQRDPYVFYVGGFEDRKNVPTLVRGFAAAQLGHVPLVLAGGDERSGTELAALAASLGVGSQLRLVGAVPDEDLPALYAGALCFVYPSRYEGFGLQLCEAMAAGCPILASDATSLPEVLGDGGATFSPGRPDELATLLRRVAQDSTFRAELVERARRRSAAFSWERTAQATLEIYHRVVAEVRA